MAKKPLNPFATLGIPPECLVGLNEHEIRRFVDERGRGLSRLFHPDVNKTPGAAPRFKEVQTALDELSIDALFEEHLRNHMRRSSVKKRHELSEAEKVIPEFRPAPRAKTPEEIEGEILAEIDICSGCLTEYLVEMAIGRHIKSVQYGRRDDQLFHDITSMFDPPPCRILLSDSMRSWAIDHFRKIGGLRPSPKELIYGNLLFVEVEIREDGSVWTYPVEKVINWTPASDEPPPPSTPSDWIKGHKLTARSHYFRRKTEVGTLLEDKLIGTMTIFVQDKPAASFFPRMAQRATGDDHLLYREAMEGYHFEHFQRVASRMTPFIQYGANLVAVNLREEEPRFRILGTVTNITFP